MNYQEFSNYCLAKPGVTADFPFRKECVWMKVMGKMFALANVTELKMENDIAPPFHFINLKCDPDKAVELRAAHEEIQPGWHQTRSIGIPFTWMEHYQIN